MPTAIGAYATIAAVKSRLGIGVSDTADDPLIASIVDQVNGFIESPDGTGRVLAPISSATYLFDGDGSDTLYVPNGVRAISAMSIGDSTGASRVAAASTDYFLRPLAQDRDPGWPATRIVLSDAGAFYSFGTGYETVSVTMTCGWASIPDEITDLALTMAVRAWHARQNGQADIVGSDETGAPVVSRFVSARDRGTLAGYRRVVLPR
jgi:hypothetical protein